MPPAAKDRDRDRDDPTGLELRRVRERERELKRTRGEISCAECRRLKLRCDKKAPCASCIRRGCRQICPTGIDTRATRPLALAAPARDPRTQRALAAMGERIRVLEDALQVEVASAGRGGDGRAPHPLLAPELLAIKHGVDGYDGSASVRAGNEDEDEDEMVGAFGTLSIDEGRSMRFLGASATEHLLLMDESEPNNTPLHAFEWPALPPELAQLSAMWPFAPLYLPKPVLAAQLVAQLPPPARATALSDAYFANLAWFLGPVDRAQVVEDLLPLFYTRCNRAGDSSIGASEGDPAGHLHDLALLLLVFACGALADLALPPNNPEAERYHQLARAALGLQSPFDGGSLSACQACFLLCSYEVYAGRKTSQETSWKFMSLSLSLAASIGLHRDPARWKLDSKTVYRRRRVFWELYVIDNWRSLATGRPTLFSPNVIDCEFPEDKGATIDEDGTVVASVWRWRYRFARDVLPHLTEKLCSARTLKYSEILELDKRIRDFETHPYVTRPPPDYGPGNEAEFRRRHPLLTLWFKEIAFMYIHRNFFARAILEYPSDPMRSPFAPSFLATYRSATTILRVLREAFNNKLTSVLYRMWSTWAHLLSASVIVGSASCRPAISFASSAFAELEQAIELCKKGTAHPVVKHGLPLLLRLRDKALASLFNSQQQQHVTSRASRAASGDGAGNDKSQLTRMPVLMLHCENDQQAEEELLILRGTTRFVELRSASAPSHAHTRRAIAAAAAAQDPASVHEDLSPASANCAPPPPSSSPASGTTPANAAIAMASPPESARGAGTHAKALFGNIDMARLFAATVLRGPGADTGGQSEDSGSGAYDHTAADAPPPPPAPSGAARRRTQIEMARAWLAGVEQDRAAAIVAQLSAQQEHPGLDSSQRTNVPSTAAPHPQQPQQQDEQWSWPPTASSMISAFQGPSDLSTGASASGYDSTLFDAQEDADAFMSFPVSFTPMVDQSGEAVAAEAEAEAWHAFVQQSGFVDADPALEAWEGVFAFT